MSFETTTFSLSSPEEASNIGVLFYKIKRGSLNKILRLYIHLLLINTKRRLRPDIGIFSFCKYRVIEIKWSYFQNAWFAMGWWEKTGSKVRATSLECFRNKECIAARHKASGSISISLRVQLSRTTARFLNALGIIVNTVLLSQRPLYPEPNGGDTRVLVEERDAAPKHLEFPSEHSNYYEIVAQELLPSDYIQRLNVGYSLEKFNPWLLRTNHIFWRICEQVKLSARRNQQAKRIARAKLQVEFFGKNFDNREYCL